MTDTMADPKAVPEHVWRQAIFAASLPPMRKLVALAMALHCNYATGEDVWPAMATVARRAGLNPDPKNRTAGNHVRALVRDGWLTPTGKKGPMGVKVYRLTLPEGVAGDTQ